MHIFAAELIVISPCRGSGYKIGLLPESLLPHVAMRIRHGCRVEVYLNFGMSLPVTPMGSASGDAISQAQLKMG